jgi:hypothetical protein
MKQKSHPNPGACYVLEEVKKLLLERGTKYGPASEHFHRTCCLLEIIFPTEKLKIMLNRAEEGALAFKRSDWALIMICDKLARLSNPKTLESNDHTDTMDDIIGYAALMRDLYEEELGP